MGWHLTDGSFPPRLGGWDDVFAHMAWLKLAGLKLAGLKAASLTVPALGFGFGGFYALTAGSFFNFLTLCVSHGVAIGAGAGAIYLTYRRQAAAGLEELDLKRAAFDRKMADDELAAEIARDKLRAEAEAANAKLKADAASAGLMVVAEAERRARQVKAESEAAAYKVREQAEAGSLQAQLAEANDRITANTETISKLEAQLATSLARADHFARNLVDVATEALHDRQWGRKGDSDAAPPPA